MAVILSIGHCADALLGHTPPTPSRASNAIPANKAKEGRTLFQQNCVKCHGVDGSGDTTDGEILGTPNFTDSKWQEKSDDLRLFNSIKHGRGQMPSFEKKFSKEQIKLLVKYVRAFRS